MAVKKISDKDGKLILEFENGDRERFQTLLHDWNFKDEQSILRFMMGVMLQTTDKTLTIKNADDGFTQMRPAGDLLK